MPTTYAHWRFGDKCIKTLPKNLQTIINTNREIFDYGVHGPDMFFYYKCYKANDVTKYGSNMHDTPFIETLDGFKPLYLISSHKDALLAYLLGFLSHFTLDSYCHGYVELKDSKQPVKHLKIESQFDRFLLIKDGYDPVKKSATFSLKPTRQIANIIAELYPNYTNEIIYDSIRDQKFYLDVIKDNSRLKRFFINKLLSIAKADKFKDLMITEESDPRCKDSNERLFKYFKTGVKHYPMLAKSLIAYLNDNKRLDKYFKHNFNHKKDYLKIPLLEYKEELKYKILDLQK